MADISPYHRILDVGTGTGVVALNAARSLDHPGKVVGIDLSEVMLMLAERKASEAGLSDLMELFRMDAEALEFEDFSFDTVLSLFALLHFPEPLQALKEMFRVLKPGGKLVIVVGSPPPLISLTGLIHRLRRLYDILLRIQGKLLTAPQFLNSLVEIYFPDPVISEETYLAQNRLKIGRNVLALIKAAGFNEVQSYWEGYRSSVASPEEFWDLQRTFSSVARKRLMNAPEGKVTELIKDFVERCQMVQSRGGRLVYTYAGFYISAKRPTRDVGT